LSHCSPKSWRWVARLCWTFRLCSRFIWPPLASRYCLISLVSCSIMGRLSSCFRSANVPGIQHQVANFRLFDQIAGVLWLASRELRGDL
jgi:hypothetical protein